MTASRMQRWALLLSAYNFTIEYINTNANTADALSRLVDSYKAKDRSSSNDDEPEQTYLHFASEALMLDFREIKKETQRDPILGRVLSFIRDGWPDEVDSKELKPYFNRRLELYSELGCIMWGHRLVVPKLCHNKILQELHDVHMGIVKTKCIARSYVWWPGIDEAVEAMCRACSVCAETAASPPHHAPQPWPWPSRPWSRLHLDFLGPIDGRRYLVLIDAYSKWIEICQMNTTTANSVINKLREIFARFGIPRQIVSDNGPPFSSEEFRLFLMHNGMEHLLSAPYHPASNGAAENAVKTCKMVITKAVRQGVNTEVALQRYLLMYRNTEHSTTGESPALMLLGRSLRTRLDRLKPSREQRVQRAQERQLRAAGGGHRELQPGDAVWYRTYRGPTKWLEGAIDERLGSTDYNIISLDGTVVHRHIDQIKLKSKHHEPSLPKGTTTPSNGTSKQGLVGWPQLPVESETGGSSSDSVSGSIGSELGGGVEGSGTHSTDTNSVVPSTGERRYPLRERKPPNRYGYS
ncbi:uncharacterized protein K02A2.6-like [Ostrinia nubilalis]|uniref:uncharacterized protein K02A2.6-like n=1 Tax=Ostrinia nubilalis TaxID=29057 RepID=UPI003082616E